MSFAEQKGEIRRFILVEVQQIDLAIAVFALRTMPMKFRAVQVYLRVHCIYCFGTYLRVNGMSKTIGNSNWMESREELEIRIDVVGGNVLGMLQSEQFQQITHFFYLALRWH